MMTGRLADFKVSWTNEHHSQNGYIQTFHQPRMNRSRYRNKSIHLLHLLYNADLLLFFLNRSSHCCPFANNLYNILLFSYLSPRDIIRKIYQYRPRSSFLRIHHRKLEARYYPFWIHDSLGQFGDGFYHLDDGGFLEPVLSHSGIAGHSEGSNLTRKVKNGY